MKVNTSTAVDNRMLVLLIIILICNTLLVGLNFYLSYPQKTEAQEEMVFKQGITQDLLEYGRRLAQEKGVQNRPAVREALANFSYEIDLAKDSDELSRIIFSYGRQVQETILREWDALMREKILNIVNQDAAIQRQAEKMEFALRISSTNGVEVDPPILHEETIEEIFGLYQEGGLTQEQVFRIEVVEGRSRMLVPYSPLDYIQTLSEEIDSLRVSLHEVRVAAGFAEMSGNGVVVRLYDAPAGYGIGDIIHDSDVRDVVNELFAAGARGVAVGGQRLIATSPIRCVGPVIRVNQKEIPANPVVIEAVGDPEVLASGLDIIRFSFEFHRNFRFEVDKKEGIVLPPFRN